MEKFYLIKKDINIKTSIPIRIELNNYNSKKSCFLKLTNFRKAEIQIELDSDSGEIISFKIVYPSIVNIYNKSIREDIQKYETEKPVIKRDNWDMSYDLKLGINDISIDLYNNSIIIQIMGPGSLDTVKFVKTDRLILGIDSYGDIGTIKIDRLTTEEYQGLKQTLEELIIDMKNNPYIEKRPLFKNKIYRLNETQMEEIKKHLIKDEKLYIVDIDGSNIQTELEYLRKIEKEFKFPIAIRPNFDGYLDWIRDLSWLNKEGYILIIRNYSKFLKKNTDFKNKIIADFKRHIQPFWLRDIKEIVVGGKPQRFDVYLVD